MWWERALIRGAHQIHSNVGVWIAHKLGYNRWVSESFSHAHGADCAKADVEYLVREGGSVRRCRTCGYPIEIKLACWETKGFIPENVVKWLTDELTALAALEGRTPHPL